MELQNVVENPAAVVTTPRVHVGNDVALLIKEGKGTPSKYDDVNGAETADGTGHVDPEGIYTKRMYTCVNGKRSTYTPSVMRQRLFSNLNDVNEHELR